MVDPNRKINRLTERDIEFLEECEQEFSSRYSENDEEFMKYCLKPLDNPPIAENYYNAGGDFPRNDGGGYYHNRGGNRNGRNWRNFRKRSSVDNHKDYMSSQTTYNREYSSVPPPPMKIRRDYTNFVPASKDD